MSIQRFDHGERRAKRRASVIRHGKLDQDIAIQADHYRPNISSANSSCEIMGVRTLRPLKERMLKIVAEEISFSEADTILATALLP
jgi:hypothetical protein